MISSFSWLPLGNLTKPPIIEWPFTNHSFSSYASCLRQRVSVLYIISANVHKTKRLMIFASSGETPYCWTGITFSPDLCICIKPHTRVTSALANELTPSIVGPPLIYHAWNKLLRFVALLCVPYRFRKIPMVVLAGYYPHFACGNFVRRNKNYLTRRQWGLQIRLYEKFQPILYEHVLFSLNICFLYCVYGIHHNSSVTQYKTDANYVCHDCNESVESEAIIYSGFTKCQITRQMCAVLNEISNRFITVRVDRYISIII